MKMLLDLPHGKGSAVKSLTVRKSKAVLAVSDEGSDVLILEAGIGESMLLPQGKQFYRLVS